jgi:dUTP pyrophosphatase
MTELNINVVQLDHAAGLALPDYQTPGSAGADLLAAVGEKSPLVLNPSNWMLVPTGLVLELPSGVEAQIRPRSGLAAKFGITVLNSPGTIDSDYRGEVKVILINHGPNPFTINHGERIAQMVLASTIQAKFVAAAELSTSERGEGGFGSTGK